MTDPKPRMPRPKSGKDLPPAGPHDKPELTDPLKTPGTGMLPTSGKKDIDVDSSTG